MRSFGWGQPKSLSSRSAQTSYNVTIRLRGQQRVTFLDIVIEIVHLLFISISRRYSQNSFTAGKKHFEIRRHHVRESYDNGLLKIKHIRMLEQKADILMEAGKKG